MASSNTKTRSLSVLLATVSAAALFAATPGSHALELGGGTAPAPSAAALAAAQSGSQEAARAARENSNALKRATLSIQTMQASQGAARDAARAALQAMPQVVPNGLRPGGLQIGTGVVGSNGSVNRELWKGADLPTEFTDGDRIKVAVKQNEQKAILTWDTFNVGDRTDLTFQQQAGNWVVLNRVLGTDAKPSQILGSINASGQVLVINQNGIVFGGTSQVNVGALIASTAKIDTQKFLDSGIYSSGSGRNWIPSFTDAAALLGKAPGGGVVKVEAGARITTRAPASVTAGGGFVLLMGGVVDNAGAITTPNGQTQLAAGDDFVLRRGYGTDANLASTTRGNEIAPLFKAGSSAGLVRNSGMIFSPQGDITLAGRTVEQNGILVATTSVNTRGTIHLLNSATDKAGSVTLGAGSVTTIIPELESKETALNSQRDALIKASAGANAQRSQSASGSFDNLSLLADRLDQSRIEIVSGGNVIFKGGVAGSLTIAQGGQTAVSAGGRIVTEGGATIDVSGVRDVVLAMATNNLKVNIQGNELRDSPANRDKNDLKNKDVWVDIRDLIYVPAGTGGYDADRYYTRGGLLEVGGYLANTAHSIGEWSTVGGTITLAAAEVVAQAGSVFDISGGSVKYESGAIRTTNFLGRDGRLYNIDNARADMTFYGLGQGHVREHARWGFTEVWTGPFGRGREHVSWEAGYTVGRDAGQLVLSAPTAVFEGNILADAVTGTRQRQARPDGTTDGYKLGQTQVSKAGQLLVGSYGAQGRLDAHNSAIVIGDITGITKGLDTSAALPSTRNGTLWFDAGHLNAQKLGGLDLATRGKISIERDLTLADGGSLNLIAPIVDFKANVTAKSGSVSATNVFRSTAAGAVPVILTSANTARVTLHAGARLDLTGHWSNLLLDPNDLSKLAYVDGGKVQFESSHDVVLAGGSRIDVSSGAALLANAKTQGGKGGDVSLIAGSEQGGNTTGRLRLDGELAAFGVNGGGKLAVTSGGKVLIGAKTPVEGALNLSAGRFQSGFSAYDINGQDGLIVAEGATIDVAMPVYRLAEKSRTASSSSDPAGFLELWTPPVYREDPRASRLVQRGRADLTLRSQRSYQGGGVEIGKGATVSVDPGAEIRIAAPGQMTVEGRLNAWGGRITFDVVRSDIAPYDPTAHNRSIWIGEQAVLDVAGRGASAVDGRGYRYGLAQAGGTIQLGSVLDWESGEPVIRRPPGLHVVIRPGAMLDASGSSVVLDLPGANGAWQPVNVASNGGTIVMGSANALFIDGTLRAAAGGEGAAGGTLALTFQFGLYQKGQPADEVLAPRSLVLTRNTSGDRLGKGTKPGDKLAYGTAYLGVDQIEAGGFDNLSIFATMRTPDDLTLNMRQSLRLWSPLGVAADAAGGRIVSLSAPYIKLGQAVYGPNGNTELIGAQPVPTSPKRNDTLRISASHIDVHGRNEFVGFGDVALSSRGDIRLLSTPTTVGSGRTTLFAPRLMTVMAAQIYAGTGADGYLGVGDTNGGGVQVASRPDDRLIIRSWGGPAPDMPFSVAGKLTIAAGLIEQGGVLRAPLGAIVVGDVYSNPVVRFLGGSVTSVSGAGLVMPYGGTIDGIKYEYAGADLAVPGIGGTNVSSERNLTIAGKQVVVEAGAVLDMSGGGDLRGAGFVSGRGGSVNILAAALVDSNPAFGFSRSRNRVYALVPGYAGGYAPVGSEMGAGAPAAGQQVTIPNGVPGLPAGTYTLMPSNYALLPGAFRVEIGEVAAAGLAGVTPVGSGSFVAPGYLGTVNTSHRSAQASQLIITPADAVRRHSGYNETSYNDFILADAARRNLPRGMLTIDARALRLKFSDGAGLDGKKALLFDGAALFNPAKDSKGFGGILTVSGKGFGGSTLQILADGQAPLKNLAGMAIEASQLNAFGANRMVLGGTLGGNGQTEVAITGDVGGVILRSGAILRAPEVVMTADGGGLGVLMEQGATISTIGLGRPGFSSDEGYFFRTSTSAFVVSNGWVNLLAAIGEKKPTIDIGGCAAGNVCAGDTRILTEGTIGVATNGAFTLRDSVSYGARDLVLAVSAVNLGSAEALAKARASGQLAPGMALNQSLLTSLLAGNTAQGTPALQSLVLNARDAFNIYGSVTLDTLDMNGKSRLKRLVFGAPAIYGYGSASDVTTIRTGEFIWAGTVPANTETTYRPGDAIAVAPGAAILDRLGGGTLDIVAETIRFGYTPNSQQVRLVPTDRIALGFDTVNLKAGKLISADANNGTLHVYRKQTGYAADKGWSYAGGDLNITAPLLTGGFGGKLAVHAGGAIAITGSSGGEVPAINQLGAELRFVGQSIRLDTAVVLPSGKLVLEAAGDVMLGNGAKIDLSGREITIFDAKRYSWAGDLLMSSRDGNVSAAAGSVIDISAAYNRGGSISATALGEGAGRVDLLGTIRGKASGVYDAGGTLVPYDAGQLTVRAQTLTDFVGLNERLNKGELFGARRFQVKQGDLVVGDEVKAREVQIVLDGGDLTVNGRIDASGYQVGAIRLAAKGNLTINGTLDAHASGIRLDSYGKPIDAANRAVVELTSRKGTLVLRDGAVVDLRAGTGSIFADNVARGTLDLIAPRVGSNDVAVDARGTVDVRGARTVAVYGMRSYDDAPLAALPDVSGTRPQLITQAYLDGIDDDSRAFMDAALVNPSLTARLSGLSGHRLRPGVEITSNATTNPGGNLTVAGDIDLSGYRYGPDANRLDPARRGFGEPGMLALRAAGNLNVHGSINDGFAPPAATPDDKGWLLTEGRESYYFNGHTPFGGDIVVPIDGVVLDVGTVFPAGAVLNYDITVRAVTLPEGSTVPVEVSLTGKLTLPAGLVLSADVKTADGRLYKAGTVLAETLTLDSGSKLGAGFQLRSDVAVGSFTLPRGTKLPTALTTNGQITLARGSLIPSMTKVELVGDKPVNLRPVDADGRQGRNWAMAPMLPEGTTSWDLTAVAGADLGSSDMRAQNALGTGDIVLADTHYGSIGKVNIRFEGGSGPGGGISLTPAGAVKALGDASFANLNAEDLNALMKSKLGASFEDYWGMSLAAYCALEPGACVMKQPTDGKTWSFNAEGSLAFFGEDSLAGKTQAEVDAWMQENWGMSWEYVFNKQSLADVCKSSGNETFCSGKLDKPVLTADGALGWIGDKRFAGLTAAALDAALVDAYGSTFQQLTGSTLPDFCEANPTQCQAAGFEPPKEVRDYVYSFGSPAFSVLRTGTGNLSLVAGRDVAMMSLYGVYTAGEQSSIAGINNSRFNLPRSGENGAVLGDLQGGGHYDGVLSAWRAWYPDHGGNLLVSAGRNILGDSMGEVAGSAVPDDRHTGLLSSVGVGNWLWRQGTGTTAGVDAVDTSWWINFGAYVQPSNTDKSARMAGFTGFGALGGGNVKIQAAGDAGIISGRGEGMRRTTQRAERSQGLVVAVGSTGRVVGGDLVLTGGGDLDIRIGGLLNPNAYVSQQGPSSGNGGLTKDNLDLNGVFTNLRGTLKLAGGGMGGMTPTFGDGLGVRPSNPFAMGGAHAIAGPVLMLGDSTAWLDTRGDLVLSGAGNPGLVRQPGSAAHTNGGVALDGKGQASFSLWTPATAINLLSAGGDLAPASFGEGNVLGSNLLAPSVQTGGGTRYYHYYPSILRAVAPGGDIRIAGSPVVYEQRYDATLLLAPSPTGALEFLAGGSIRAGSTSYAISMSGAAMEVLATPFKPAFVLSNWKYGETVLTNQANNGMDGLFAFGPNTVTRALHGNDPDPVRFYAANGDITGLRVGATVTGFVGKGPDGKDRAPDGYWYEMAKAVRLRAGTDILSVNVTAMNNHATDMSLVQAGRDIVYANFAIAGPGNLDVIAGGQIRQEDAASIYSIGAVVPGDIRPGASLSLQAGMTGANWEAVRARYFGSTNLADPGLPLADPKNAGKVVKVYDKELAAWLVERFGFTGAGEEALTYFDTLAPEQQRIFLRQVYYAETREGGREYNDTAGPRFGSYLRGRQMIAALFPDKDADGNTITRRGDIVMYGGSGIRTNFGGDIQMMAPGGQIVIGVEGKVPPASAGVITQGSGNIQMYSKGSVLIGLSRIITTFGGGILAWSGEGDINAGRGAKTTVLYTPPKRVYDDYGVVTLSPNIPSAGAGIATLNPIPEVKRGDVDLVAPLGTIDAGEAGIRFSGNVNVAALHIVNAANIQGQGTMTGVPQVVAPNIGGLTEAGNVAGAASKAAANPAQSGANEQPSIIIVEVLGFGGGSGGEKPEKEEEKNARAGTRQQGQSPDSPVQVVGAGPLDRDAASRLTDEERKRLVQ